MTRNPASLAEMQHDQHLRVIGTDYSDAIANALPPACSIIHLAAQRNAPVQSPNVYEPANVAVAETLTRAAITRSAMRLVHVSTALVLGSSADPIDETHPLDDGRAGAYVRSRITGLLAVERIAGDTLPLVTLLPSIIFGPDHPRAHNRITAHIRRVLRAPLRVAIGRRQPQRNLVFVEDVVQAIARAEQHDTPRGRAIVSGENVTQEQLEAEVCAAAGKTVPRRIVLPGALAVGAARAMDALLRFDPASGWTIRMRTLLQPWCLQPRNVTSFAEGIRRTVHSVLAEQKAA